MNKTFAIGIPTINRYDLLHDALEQYFIDFPTTEIYIIDNGKQNIRVSGEGIHVIRPQQNLGVAASWNLLCIKIFAKHDYALILNDDIYLGAIEDQIKPLLYSYNDVGFIVGTGTWCAFLMPKKTWKEVGKFDENFFPAYFEDNDYHYRLKLAKKNVWKNDLFDPKVYRNSQSIVKDKSLNKRFNDNKKYYVKKWGGEPGKEKFISPFDGIN